MRPPIVRTADTPRLAERADVLWERIRALSAQGVQTPECGLLYPVLRLDDPPAMDFAIDASGTLNFLMAHGMARTPADEEQRRELFAALLCDRLWVLLLSRPGYASRWGERRTIRELHRPLGLGFHKEAA